MQKNEYILWSLQVQQHHTLIETFWFDLHIGIFCTLHHMSFGWEETAHKMFSLAWSLNILLSTIEAARQIKLHEKYRGISS